MQKRAFTSMAIMRKRFGLSQHDLSVISGVGQTTISRIEQGIASPNVNTLKKIAKALNCTVADLCNPPQPSCAELEIQKKLEMALRSQEREERPDTSEMHSACQS